MCLKRSVSLGSHNELLEASGVVVSGFAWRLVCSAQQTHWSNTVLVCIIYIINITKSIYKYPGSLYYSIETMGFPFKRSWPVCILARFLLVYYAFLHRKLYWVLHVLLTLIPNPYMGSYMLFDVSYQGCIFKTEVHKIPWFHLLCDLNSWCPLKLCGNRFET